MPSRVSSGRVLMLTPDVYYLDRRIVQEAGTLAGQGFAVDIYATNPVLRTAGAELPEGVRILPAPRAGCFAGGLAMSLRRLKRGLRETVPALHRAVDAFHHRLVDRCEQITKGNLPLLLRGAKYTLVFAHDLPVLPLAARLKEAWGCPLICDLHEVYPEMEGAFSSSAARRYWRGVEREYLPVADGVVVVNEAVGDYVRDNYALSAPTAVILNAAPYVETRPAPARSIRDLYGIPEGVRVLLFAGTLIQTRNLELLLTGFLRAELKGWALAFLGTGPLLGRLRRAVGRANVGNQVLLGESVPPSDVVAVASTADAGVIPYPTDGRIYQICTPNKLFEYAQARLPIVASRLPLVEKILAENGCGVSLDMDTSDRIAASLRRFAERDIGQFTPEILERAARNLCWQNEAPKLLDLVRSASSTAI